MIMNRHSASCSGHRVARLVARFVGRCSVVVSVVTSGGLLAACQSDNSQAVAIPSSTVVGQVDLQPLAAPSPASNVSVTVREISDGFAEWGRLPDEPNVLHVANGTMYWPADPSVGTSVLRGVLQRELTDQQAVTLVERMDALGLFSSIPIDAGSPGKTDQATTEIVLTDDAGSRTHSVYALGEKDGLTADQLAFRDALSAWLADPLGEGAIAAQGTPSDLMVFSALRLRVQVIGVVEEQALQQDNLKVARIWPLNDRLVDGCQDLTGEDARVVLDALVDVTPETVWVNDGRWVRMSMRGLLDGEPGCP